MKRQKNKAKAHRSRGPGIAVEPRTETTGKLEPKWTGPFMLMEKTRPGSFHLADSEGRVLEHSWNADNPRRLFIYPIL
jgi:hypothetical protein